MLDVAAALAAVPSPVREWPHNGKAWCEQEAAGCKILLAQKAFSLWHVYPIIREYLDGSCSSGAWEAQLVVAFWEQ